MNTNNENQLWSPGTTSTREGIGPILQPQTTHMATLTESITTDSNTQHTTTVLRPFVRDYPGEPIL